jgi:hypothetical protein
VPRPEQCRSLLLHTRHGHSVPEYCNQFLAPIRIKEEHQKQQQRCDRKQPIMIEFFVVFLSSSKRMLGEYLQIRPRPIPTKSFPIHHNSLIIRTSTLYSLLTEKASLNKLPTYRPTAVTTSHSFSLTLTPCADVIAA